MNNASPLEEAQQMRNELTEEQAYAEALAFNQRHYPGNEKTKMIAKILVQVQLDNPFVHLPENQVLKAYAIASQYFQAHQGNGENKPLLLTWAIPGSSATSEDIRNIELSMHRDLKRVVELVSAFLAASKSYDIYKDQSFSLGERRTV